MASAKKYCNRKVLSNCSIWSSGFNSTFLLPKSMLSQAVEGDLWYFYTRKYRVASNGCKVEFHQKSLASLKLHGKVGILTMSWLRTLPAILYTHPNHALLKSRR